MCTVTYIPSKNTTFITSIRDEKSEYSPGIPPDQYDFSSGKIIFPKDTNAGGSWIACHENGNAVAFLDDVLTVDESGPPYRKSRGLILLDLADHTTPFNCFLAINLNKIAPFVAIIQDNFHLFECSWNGKHKSHNQLDSQLPHIWSSATLYNDDAIRNQQLWFEKRIGEMEAISSNNILDFHRLLAEEKEENKLSVNDGKKRSTSSITSMSIGPQILKMQYLDTIKNQFFDKELGPAAIIAKRP